MAVTKDPNCRCCGKWVARPRDAGFRVMVTEGPVSPVETRLGVPRDLASCHTAQVGGYVVEGHVPAGAIRRLLAERPDTYDVVLFGPGKRSTFARYRGAEPT